jgi:hypothetical protein
MESIAQRTKNTIFVGDFSRRAAPQLLKGGDIKVS